MSNNLSSCSLSKRGQGHELHCNLPLQLNNHMNTYSVRSLSPNHDLSTLLHSGHIRRDSPVHIPAKSERMQFLSLCCSLTLILTTSRVYTAVNMSSCTLAPSVPSSIGFQLWASLPQRVDWWILVHQLWVTKVCEEVVQSNILWWQPYHPHRLLWRNI